MSVTNPRSQDTIGINVMPPSNNDYDPEMNCLGNRSYQSDF